MRTAAISGTSKLLSLLLRRSHGPADSPTSQLNLSRILLLKPCCLGDVLLTTPLLAALRRNYPQSEITYAVGAWARPMIETSRHIDAVLTIPDRWTVGSIPIVARELRKRGFDAVFVPERSPVPGVLTLLAGIPIRVGLDSQGRGFAYTHPVLVPETVIHEADLYLLLAQALGLAPGERRLWFFPTAEDRREAERLLAELPGEGPLVVLHPGGGSNPGMLLERKRWLPERWARVVDTLHAERGARVLIVGSANEASIAAAVGATIRTQAAVMARQWRWGVLAAVIESAALFLGHDTGMSLLANAVGTPHVVVFGPSDPQMYGPYGASGRSVWRPTRQSPCFYNGTAPIVCPCAGQCMRNVEVADVLRAIESVLDMPRRYPPRPQGTPSLSTLDSA